MKPLEIYENIRKQTSHRLSLRWQLTLFVSAELVLSALLSLGLYYIITNLIPIHQSILLFLILIAVSMIIGGLVTSFVAKYFFDPIRNMRKNMEKVASGDFTVRLEEHSASNEIMEVYSGFNLMVSQLQATEILQTDFVSNVSHEFKTPINAIEGYATLLQNNDDLTDDQRKYLEKILFNTKRLSSLVGSILLLSKIENQSIPDKVINYRLDEQIRQAIVSLEPLWEQKGTEFDIELDSISYSGNEMLMRHVWENLISNAIKFGPENDIIKIRLIKESKNAKFTIENKCAPLSEDTLLHLFDKFYQGDSSHKADGNGLGLALVKKILDLSGNQISAESTENGCCFTVTLTI